MSHHYTHMIETCFTVPSSLLKFYYMVVSQHADLEPKWKIKEKFTHIWVEKIFEVLQFLHLYVPEDSVGSVIWSLFYCEKC
jgi:hypothetical protein